MVGLFFVLNLYLQEILGYSAVRAGLSSLPLGLMLISAAGAAGPLLERIGTKAVLISGLGLFTVGLAWLAQIPLHASYVSDILLQSLPIGAGLGLLFVTITSESVASIHADQTGLAGGLINATQQIGGAIGLAVITAVATSYTSGAAHDPTNVVHGFPGRPARGSRPGRCRHGPRSDPRARPRAHRPASNSNGRHASARTSMTGGKRHPKLPVFGPGGEGAGIDFQGNASSPTFQKAAKTCAHVGTLIPGGSREALVP